MKINPINLTQNSFFCACLLLVGLLVGLGALTARTLIDARDVDKVVQLKTPGIFKTDPQYTQIYNDIITRPLYLDPDSYYWILYSTDLVRNKNLRIRWNNYDNTPYGRPVHWNSGYAWFLVSLGKINSILTGKDLISGIEHAGRWADPIIAGIFGTFWGIVLGFRFNLLMGCLFPLMFFFFGAFREDMSYAIADHHILHLSLALSQLLAIVAGGSGFVRNNYFDHKRYSILNSFQPLDYKNARRWFIASAIFGAAGLWVGATQQSIIIGLIGAGGTIAALICSPKKATGKNSSEITLRPYLWRWWGWTGAGLTILFYLLEYFPDHLEMRLEVNHPLYGLAWLGGSEIVYRICSLRGESSTGHKTFSDFFWISMALLALSILPILILFGPDSWHAVHNPFIRRMHDYIYEFMPILDPNLGVTFNYFLLLFGLYPLFLIISVTAFGGRFFNVFQRTIIIQSLVPSIALAFFFFFQQRWDGLLGTVLIVLALSFFSAILHKAHEMKKSSLALHGVVLLIFILLTPSWIFLIRNNYFPENPDHSITNRYCSFTLVLLAREIAINFKKFAPEDEIRLLSDTSIVPALGYYGIWSVGSLYWENGEGIKDYTGFFSAYSDSSALEIVRKRGVTHVLLPIWSIYFADQIQWSKNFAKQVHWTYWGDTQDENVKKALVYRLASDPTNPPEWLEPFPFFHTPFCRLYGMICYRVKLSGK